MEIDKAVQEAKAAVEKAGLEVSEVEIDLYTADEPHIMIKGVRSIDKMSDAVNAAIQKGIKLFS